MKGTFPDTIAIAILKRVLIREVGSCTSTSMYFCICFVNVLFINPYVLASIPMLFDSNVICFYFCFSVYTLLHIATYFDDCLQPLLLKYNSRIEVV